MYKVKQSATLPHNSRWMVIVMGCRLALCGSVIRSRLLTFRGRLRFWIFKSNRKKTRLSTWIDHFRYFMCNPLRPLGFWLNHSHWNERKTSVAVYIQTLIPTKSEKCWNSSVSILETLTSLIRNARQHPRCWLLDDLYVCGPVFVQEVFLVGPYKIMSSYPPFRLWNRTQL